MKIGQYLRAKKSFTRTIYTSTKDTKTGDTTDFYENGTISVIENKKYQITNIFKLLDNNLVELNIDDKKICFAVDDNNYDYEYIYSLFTDDIASIRSEKIQHLNDIINTIDQFLCE